MYFDQLMLMATNIDVQVSVDNMQMYIVGLALIRTMFRMLQDALYKGSKSV